jgi:hypothetical protein
VASQFGVRCHTTVIVMEGKENGLECRDRISQSHRAAVRSLLSTSLIIIAIGVLKYSIHHGLRRGDDEVIIARLFFCHVITYILCWPVQLNTRFSNSVIVFVIPQKYTGQIKPKFLRELTHFLNVFSAYFQNKCSKNQSIFHKDVTIF